MDDDELMSPEEFNRRLNAAYDNVRVNSFLCGGIVAAIGIVISAIGVMLL
jgi:hypothetical protein